MAGDTFGSFSSMYCRNATVNPAAFPVAGMAGMVGGAAGAAVTTGDCNDLRDDSGLQRHSADDNDR